MLKYEDKKEIVVRTLVDAARIKTDTISLKQATAYNAMLLVADLADYFAYNTLFDALKRDCKDAGYKFAGTPMHKNCNVVKSIKFDYPKHWEKINESADSRTEKTPEERLFWAFQEFLKENKLTFSATQCKIAETLNPQPESETPENDSFESLENNELQAVLTYIRTCGNNEFQKIVDEVLARGENRAEKTA